MTEKNTGIVNYDDKIRVDVDGAWSALKGRLEKEGLIPEQEIPVRRFLTPTLKVAASILVLIALSLGAWFVLTPTENQMNLAVHTNDTEEYGFSLPDGSTVDLNAHSKIQFNQDKDGNRLVRLSGEAYFNVSPDPDRPFIIMTGSAVVRVTGTSFSVRTLPDTRRVEVYVESGNVQFYQSGDTEKIIDLESGNMGVLEDNIIKMEVNRDENYLSWKTRKLAFRQSNLGEVAEVLNRTYKKEILFENDELEKCLFTGTFDGQPVDSVVRVIQLAFNLDVDRNRNSYVFSGEGCN